MSRYAELIKELRDEAVSDRDCELHNTGDWHDEIADALEALTSVATAPNNAETPGLREAIAFVQGLHDAYVRDFGIYDPSTNATEFRGAAEDVDSTYAEILDGLRDLALSAPPQPVAVPDDGAQGHRSWSSIEAIEERERDAARSSRRGVR